MTTATAELDLELIKDMGAFSRDPLRFVMYTFPWGQAGTVLAQHDGPRAWQRNVLIDLRDQLQAGKDAGDAIRLAVASGHGIGKSALVAWIGWWSLSTHELTRGVVTANTDTQLKSKTWPELGKWHGLAINRHWFKFTATSLYFDSPKYERVWRLDAIPWNESKPESFAGLHNQGKRVLALFDEASTIPDKIWEVTEGAMTDENTQMIWAAFGNPTRNTGRFRECFGRFKHRWSTWQVDSRTVEGTNKAQLDKWAEDYGEDSDFYRIRVKGEFPRAGSAQLIASDLVAEASRREATSTIGDPLVLGVDVARFGDDESVLQFRRGFDARLLPAAKYRELDTMQLAGRVASAIDAHKPDAVFIDETGVGAGVVDRLRQLGFAVVGVNFGGAADGPVEDEKVANKRAEMWVRMRQWLRAGGAIADDPALRSQVESVEYGYDVRNAILLEKKDDMKKRGLSSPDLADALALTFAYPVAPLQAGARQQAPAQALTSYEPFAGGYDPFAGLGRDAR